MLVTVPRTTASEVRASSSTEIATAALSGEDPDAVLRLVVRHAAELAQADLGLVMTRGEDGSLTVEAAHGSPGPTFTDPVGNVIAWSSSGSLGFRGSRKGTPFAAQQASLTAANKAKESGLRTVEVKVSGPGAGRESAVRALSTAGIEVRSIRDVTPIPHNGCRPPKRRRV